MRILLIIGCLLNGILTLVAQPGFNKVPIFNAIGWSYMSMVNDNDTLVILGAIRTDTFPKWGRFIAKVDTNGNLLTIKPFYDSLGLISLFESEIIKTADGGYATVVGRKFNSNKPGFFKFNHEGDLENFKANQIDTAETTDGYFLTELTTGGYLYSGWARYINATHPHPFVVRLDVKGNPLWQKHFEHPNGCVSTASAVTQADESTILFSSIVYNCASDWPNYFDWWAQTWIVAIDLDGNIKWEYLSPKEHILGAATRIWVESDGSLLYSSNQGFVKADDTIEKGWGRGVLVKLNPAFEIEWISPTDTFARGPEFTYSSVRLDNEDVVTVGNRSQYGKFTNTNPNYSFQHEWGAISRFTSNGQLLWTRYDSAYWQMAPFRQESFTGVAAASSGSIFACGYANFNEPSPHTRAWLVKVSPDGCMTTLDCPTLSPIEIPVIKPVDLWLLPNPASTELNITLPESIGQANRQLNLINLLGQQLLSKAFIGGQMTVDISPFPPGPVFIQLIENGQVRAVGRAVILR